MPERIEGLSIGLDLDSVKVESGLKDLNKKLALVNSEMKANLSAFDKGDTSMKKYQTQLDGLNKKLEIQKAKVEGARQSYEKMVKVHGEGSKEADAAATAFNKESASLMNLAKYTDSVNREMKVSHSIFTKFGNGLTGISEKANQLGDGLTRTVTPAVIALGAAAVASAKLFDDAQAKIQVNMGGTAEEAAKVAGIANDVFKDGWGESLDGVSTALLNVKGQLTGIADEDLGNVTKMAIALEESLGMDQVESLRGINALMETYGMTAYEAFDYMVTGAQKGLNKTDELGDNLAEYAPLWEQNGYSAQEMFNTLQAGLDAGAYNLDKVNDLVKEFGIRVSDGTVKTAIEDMGGSWKEIYDTWEASGESNDDLFRRMSQNLASIQDPQEKANALSMLWGSIGEDAGVKVVEALGTVTEQYGEVNGAAQTVVDTLEQTQSQKFQSMFRDMADTLVPLGDILLEVGEKALPLIEEAVTTLTDSWNELDPLMQENIVKWTMTSAVAGPLVKILAGVVGGLGSMVSWIPKVTSGLGKQGVTGALETISGTAATTGGAAALFTNPWVLGIGAVVLAATGVGTLIYNEMTKDQKNHEQSVEDTKGKYQEWFDAVSKGTNDMVSSQEQIQGAIKGTGLTLAEETARLKEQNTLVTSAIDDLWNGGYEFNDEFFKSFNEPLARNVDGIKDKLKELKMSDDQIAEVEASYNNHSLTIGNAMAEVLHTFTEGKLMTAELANATINANNAVTEEIVTSLTAQRDAEQASIEGMLAGGMITTAEYQRRTEENGIHYAILIQTTQNANAEINDIIATASRESRELTAEEVGSMITSYTTLATNSGKSMTEIAEGQDALGQNMRNMVSEVAIASLEQSGALSESASSQINSLGSVEAKVGALQWALDYYNRTGIPAKTINIDVSPALQAIADLQQRLYNIPDEQVYINVAENRVYTATSPTGAQGVGYATGTDSHSGGPAVLGDGGRAEPFLTPSGLFGVSPSTDTLYPNLPQGTKVWPSIQRFKMDIPHFATGAKGSTEAQRLIASFGKTTQAKAIEKNGNVSDGGGFSGGGDTIDYNELGNAVAGAVINALLVADIKVEIDKRSFGRLVSELI
ncbi:phage tail tape measure protein [Trichococcus collinsii]|uniref:Phage-related minor tail protein n=1 Tax=Trichococcus collinsii TaxID=157076 RepID=A0AB37ZXP1_9LACT|nr:phage tail tape measure protein [Trichococcus collinsii]CZR03368.1 phage tail tape measure protein [Trichococcus collinsii]SDZ99452.1 Phage-related minor tail protein [Trichococcus collinsii]